jgi:hypothetical protein
MITGPPPKFHGTRDILGQDPQPLAQQRLDVLGPEAVADLLEPLHVVDRSEPVVQRGEADPGLRGLALGPLVGVDTQLGGIGEVGGDLEEERTETVVHAIEIVELMNAEERTNHA